MADDGSGKKVGVIGGIVAALGAVFAHEGGTCARVGAKSVAFESAGVRAGSEVGKDFGRAGLQAGAAAERTGVRGVTELGELGGATELGAARAAKSAGGVGDDVAREIAEGHPVKLGPGVVADDLAHGSPWQDLAEELGQNVIENGLDYALDQASAGDDEIATPNLAAPVHPGPDVVGLLPKQLENLKLSALDFAQSSRALFLAKLVLPASRNARFVIGYVAPTGPVALASPDGAPVSLAEIFARSASTGSATYVLGCDGQDFSSKLPCAASARSLASQVIGEKPATSIAAGRRVLELRKERNLSRLVVFAIAKVGDKRRILSSGKLLIDQKSAPTTP